MDYTVIQYNNDLVISKDNYKTIIFCLSDNLAIIADLDIDIMDKYNFSITCDETMVENIHEDYDIFLPYGNLLSTYNTEYNFFHGDLIFNNILELKKYSKIPLTGNITFKNILEEIPPMIINPLTIKLENCNLSILKNLNITNLKVLSVKKCIIDRNLFLNLSSLSELYIDNSLFTNLENLRIDNLKSISIKYDTKTNIKSLNGIPRKGLEKLYFNNINVQNLENFPEKCKRIVLSKCYMNNYNISYKSIVDICDYEHLVII